MISNKVPSGWVFEQADFSLVNSEKFHNKGRVIFTRDSEGVSWWHSLNEEQKEEIGLFVVGRGWTLEEAFEDAALSARIADDIVDEVFKHV